MSRRIWTKPFIKYNLSGDRDKAKSLERKARACVGYLFDQLMPNQKFRSQNWNLADGSKITAYVWRDVLGERARVEVFAPSPPQNELHLPEIIAFIPWSGFIPNPRTGVRLKCPSLTFGSPYIDEHGQKINGLLGTEKNTAIVGIEGDLRSANPSGCGWLARKKTAQGKWSATRGHYGHFGTMNWLGQDAASPSGERYAEKDIVSWDGPKSRYASPFAIGFVMYGGRVYHRLRVLADLTSFASTSNWGLWCTIGAAIQHTSSTIYLHQIVMRFGLKLEAVRWTLHKSGPEDENDEFRDRYVVVGGPTHLHSCDPLQDFVINDNGNANIKTGFFFSADGSKAVCTIGTNPSSGTQRTYLYKYTPESGFSRELVYDAALYEKESGVLRYLPEISDPPIVAGTAMSHAFCPPPFDYQHFTMLASHNPSTPWSRSKTYEYKTLSAKQILCADYVGNNLVFLYYENPEARTDYVLSNQGVASWTYSMGPSHQIGSCFLEPFPIPPITGTVDEWSVSSDMTTTVESPRIYSSDGRINWTGKKCTSFIRMSGNPANFTPGVPLAVSASKESIYVTTPNEVEYDLLWKPAWNGWTYTNPANCRGEKRIAEVGFLDLRFGLIGIVEETQIETADVDWLMEFGVDGEQYFEQDIEVTYSIFSGKTLVDKVTLDSTHKTIPIGVFGTGYGLDHWYRMLDYFIVLPSDQQMVGSVIYQPWGFPSKSWHSMHTPKAVDDGVGQMLVAGGTNDLIYTLAYGGSRYDPDGVNPLVSSVDPITQVSYWAGDRQPQITFCEGDMTKHMLGNIGLI